MAFPNELQKRGDLSLSFNRYICGKEAYIDGTLMMHITKDKWLPPPILFSTEAVGSLLVMDVEG